MNSNSPSATDAVLQPLCSANEGDRDSFGDLIPVPTNAGEGEETMDTDAPDQILQRLYLGDRSDGQCEWLIRQLGITHVLNVHNSCRFPSDDCGYEYLHEPLSDFGDQDLLEFLPKVFPFMTAGMTSGKVLVHCQMGVNRSASVVICYLMMHQNFTLRRAYLHTQAMRPRISPHELYFEQLQALEQHLFGKSTLTREDIGPSLQQMIRDLRAQATPDRIGEKQAVPEAVD
eukprot:CAMPEP_0169141154 /NCGR_PEP_ID=MMETSP1015-20121227/44123_1 /TAXON_ID=342587 /ORGANISM="Karlodinium micrum, Strain CCMP2283" /LENGTH=229 /DNA_ID=CAMNT_0009207451 /DNA_START=48 /DNA_END=737 /DNA_ORIENTATION=+